MDEDIRSVISKILQENIERITIFITDEFIEQIVEKTLTVSEYQGTKYVDIKNKVREELRSYIKNVN